MSKRSDTVGKLECINKFSVVVSYQSEKKFFTSPHADRLGGRYGLLITLCIR